MRGFLCTIMNKVSINSGNFDRMNSCVQRPDDPEANADSGSLQNASWIE